MLYRENIFGDDLLDIMVDGEAERVGQRMRKYRELKGITQSELGKMVDLPADRIQKYENGVRKPKSPLLKEIAKALDVSSLALVDPTPSSYINTMYVFFELENKYDVKIDYSVDKNAYMITIDKDNELYDYVKDWHNRKNLLDTHIGMYSAPYEIEKEEIETLKNQYDKWKASYPQSMTDTSKLLKRKIEIQEQIELFKQELKEIDELL